MFEEPNTKTLNHKFKVTDDYEYESEPATKEEVEKARDEFGKLDVMQIAMRSCWECNKAHNHLINCSMQCFACGRVYHNGIDITDYTGSEYEKYSHLTPPKEEV